LFFHRPSSSEFLLIGAMPLDFSTDSAYLIIVGRDGRLSSHLPVTSQTRDNGRRMVGNDFDCGGVVTLPVMGFASSSSSQWLTRQQKAVGNHPPHQKQAVARAATPGSVDLAAVPRVASRQRPGSTPRLRNGIKPRAARGFVAVAALGGFALWRWAGVWLGLG